MINFGSFLEFQNWDVFVQTSGYKIYTNFIRKKKFESKSFSTFQHFCKENNKNFGRNQMYLRKKKSDLVNIWNTWK